MTKYLFIGLIALSLIGASAVWITNMAVQAERAETLQVAVEKMAERDKLKTIARNATEEDLCRMLGGHTVDGACQ